MISKFGTRFRNEVRSWLFLSGLFWRTLVWGLAISVVAKFLVNVAIRPIPPSPSFRNLEGQIFPFPPGRFAITHAEHLSNGWPDYTEGLLGRIAGTLGSFIERFVNYDNVELIIWSSLMALILWAMASRTFNQRKDDLKFDYIGIGLFVAGGISNQGEVALFGHATDFLFVRTSDSGFLVANFADVMILSGLLVSFVGSPLYRRYKEYERAEREKSEA